ncbi:MAG: methyltransferase domain-containing protein [Acidobacteria bacterium]|nr:methyltransferase domain-containing protein [Acidobacteriota bacterium]
MSPQPDLVIGTYTRAADTFDALPFWHHYGRRTVELAAVGPGERVLDLCCGSGASALPAARAVGSTGSVVGVDLTPALIDVARANAAYSGLAQARFEIGDVTALTFPRESFDAVVSVFGIFFLDDMPAMLRKAWGWLAPGGRLATTVWGEVVLAPGEPYFWEAVRREDPSLDHISPAAKLARPEALAQLYADAGLPAPAIVREAWRMPLASPEAFWPVIMGTSNRGVFEALTPAAQGRVKGSVVDRLRDERVDSLQMEALVAIARK